MDASQAFTVYATARVQSPTVNVVAMVSIEWGHGGASLVSEYAVIKRLRVPLVGSMVKLSGRLVDAATGKPAAADVPGGDPATIAPGSDGETFARRGGSRSGPGARRRRPTARPHARRIQRRRERCWIMVFDDVARPADGTPPVWRAPRRRSRAPSAFVASTREGFCTACIGRRARRLFS